MPKAEFISKILQVLELSSDSEFIADQLVNQGRQALHTYKDDVSERIFEEQMNNNESELLNILKSCVKLDWESTITETWFRELLSQQASKSPDTYDRVLTTTAEYGSKYLQDHALLSLTIQFLFEFDIKTLNDDLFNEIRNTLISKGRNGIQDYKKYIPSEIVQQQLENNRSPLYLALEDYYRLPLKDLFDNNEIKIQNSKSFEIALESVVNHGWWIGLHNSEVTSLIAKTKFNKLIEKLQEYLNSKGLPIPNQSTTSKETISLPLQSNVISPSTDRIKTTTPSTLPEINDSTHHDTPPSSTINVDDVQLKECQIIQTCIDEKKKLQVSDLVEAGELLYIDQTLNDVLDKIIRDYHSKKHFPSFIHACLIPIMYLLKRHENLDDFIENLLFKYSQIDSSLTKHELSLRMIIHILLSSSDLSVSHQIMSLLSKRNPVPFLQPSLNDDSTSYQLVSNIVHVWDYSIPTLLSFGIGPSKGKSILINKIFLSSFEQSRPSIYFQNTIDIDFGYNSLPRRSVNIADSHGLMTISLLKEIHKFFNGFLIHIEYSYLMKNVNSIRDYLKIMKTNAYRLLIIRDVPIDHHNECSEFLSLNFSSIDVFLLPNITDQNDMQNKHFIFKIRDQIWEKQFQHDSKMNPKPKDQISEEIVPLKRALRQALINKTTVQRNFPEYVKFVELCQLKLKLTGLLFYGNENAEINDTRQKISALENSSNIKNPYEPSSIHQLFSNILETSNMLTCMELLIHELKQNRAEIVSNVDMTIHLLIQKCLSLELLWRNTIVCSQYESKDIQQQYYQYIRAGFPFEIIDGDNFYFQHVFLSKTLEPFRKHRVLVISMIGSPKSGKTTLLNQLFGTRFDIRYTRGIYGSFVKTNRSDFEYILLIDTGNLENDRLMITFCLAVSHLVIVNVVGEVSTTLQSVLTLCIDSLGKISVRKIPPPIVHFVLNQKADLNIENHQAAIHQIISDFKKVDLGQIIDIRKDNFHTLPCAYKREGQILTSNIIKTDPVFIECVRLLSKSILHSAESNQFFDLGEWLSLSQDVFDTLQKFPELTYYHDIHESRLDNEIRQYICDHSAKIFPDDCLETFIQESSDKTTEEINGLLNIKKIEIQELAEQNLEDLFKLLKISDLVRQRNQQFLNQTITEMFNFSKTSIITDTDKEDIKSIIKKGEDDLQREIEGVLQLQTSLDCASNLFNQMSNSNVQSIKKQFNRTKPLQQTIKYIYENYNVYEKEYLTSYASITNHLQFLSYWNESGASISDIQDELIMRFTKLGYEHSLVKAYTVNSTTPYSLDMIRKLVYLNKNLLEQRYSRSTSYPSSILRSSDNKQVTTTDKFQQEIRNDIQKQRPTAPNETAVNELFGISKVFEEVIKRVVQTMTTVQKELIKKIVSRINSLIMDVNTELNSFCLSLSSELQSTFHTCAVVLLTKYYYDEQVNYFNQLLSELETKRKDLREVFLSAVAVSNSPGVD